MDIDIQRQDFTVVGIGDMSGDVFGNGMLLSEHIRLVAAFDHRHIFVDPSPDAATSIVERRRLFELPRSSWDDYDRALISAGGGVWPRTAKAIALTPELRAALGIEDTIASMSPAELMHAILAAPVDLLWNGGIGTYVKATEESHADVGDKSNDGLRVNGAQVRATVIGEGGNLGLTQRGRVEYALTGGRVVKGTREAHLCTDFIDNSAGVDCSDHEVNIKILLGGAVADGSLSVAERDDLLVAMTDEVADLVLRDNYDQANALGASRVQAAPLLPVHRRMISEMERSGHLDRALEALPTDEELALRPHGADLAGTGGAAGVREDHRHQGDPRVDGAGRGLDPRRAGRLLPDATARALRRPDGRPPAAPGDRDHAAGQRGGEPGRVVVPVPRARGDRRQPGRRAARVRGGARRLRPARAVARDRVARRRHPRADPDRAAPGGPAVARPGGAVAGLQPPLTDRRHAEIARCAPAWPSCCRACRSCTAVASGTRCGRT
jgi:hypothetical protein